jgi:hypothetical protein
MGKKKENERKFDSNGIRLTQLTKKEEEWYAKITPNEDDNWIELRADRVPTDLFTGNYQFCGLKRDFNPPRWVIFGGGFVDLSVLNNVFLNLMSGEQLRYRCQDDSITDKEIKRQIKRDKDNNTVGRWKGDRWPNGLPREEKRGPISHGCGCSTCG